MNQILDYNPISNGENRGNGGGFGKNKIILLASHIENDLNDLCDEIFEVDNGNILKIK